MNERLKQLAEQARKYARDYVAECNHYGYVMEHNELEVRFEEKFAELVIEECMSVADLPNDLSGRWDHLLPSEVIAKHFGVEK